MIKLRLLLRNINVVNTGLAAVLLLFVFFVLLPSTRMGMEETLIPLNQGSPEPEGEGKVTDVRKSTFGSDFTVIAERNLFHPDRKIPEPEPEAKEPVPRPEFVLFGTMMVDNVKVAYMEDINSPQTTPGRGKRQKAVKEGETLSGYTLTRIYHDKVVMVKEDDTMEVTIIDPSKPKQRSEAVTQTAPPARPQGDEPEVSTEPRRRRRSRRQ